jgi:large subunit ribosomal protein L9
MRTERSRTSSATALAAPLVEAQLRRAPRLAGAGSLCTRSALLTTTRHPVQVILTKEMPTLGSEGSIVQVPVGYWRNYLLPNNFAKIATQDILE